MKYFIFLIAFIVIIVGIFFLGYYIGTPQEIIQEEEPLLITTDAEGVTTLPIVAIAPNGTGITAQLITRVQPGDGLILVDINDIVAAPDSQYSARIAAQVAQKHTQLNLNTTDIIFTIHSPEADIIGGQSAASAMAISVIAALTNTTLNEDIAITGSLYENGTVGPADGIIAKAKAIKQAGFTTFLVPTGRGNYAVSYNKQRTCHIIDDYNYCEIIYTEETTNLGEQLGLSIHEVSTIDEAFTYFEI